jgi:quinoprotein glucose dehydrogenase
MFRIILFATCLTAALAGCLAPNPPVGAGENWSTYLGHPSSTQYSTLDQIDRRNVRNLQVAWTFETGDSAEYQSNNLIVDGVLFTASPSRKVIALDAATGGHLWTFDPNQVNEYGGNIYEGGGRQRGVMYWSDGDDRRIFTSRGPWLYALDADTGEPISSFGEGGWIHMGDGMDVEGRPNVGMNTPGQVYHDLLIVGALVSEDVPGAIRAFDVRTGERKWIFHTLPRPGAPGSETWPDEYFDYTGGASDWSGFAVDTARGIVYASTESAGPDFYGGRRYGENLYANSVVALEADTGELLWHYQLVHHDLWDMDLPTPPTLLTVRHGGRRVDALAQGTKMGLLFVFDRVTGEPLWPVEERPVPESRIPGVQTWPTQPFPTKPPPLMRQRYSIEDVSDISPEAHQLTYETIRRDSSYGSFPPPMLTPTIIFPGFDGGFEWGGSAADPDGILYVNVSEMPWHYQLVPTRRADGSPLPLGERVYRTQCASCHGLDMEGSAGSAIPSLVDIGERRPEAYVMTILRTGGGRMPAFDQMPERMRDALVDFLFARAQPPEPPARSNADPHAVNETPPYAFRGFQRWLDAEGYPAIRPPWGTLNAVDLNTGEIKWTVPLGEYTELTARGMPPTGTENYGGPVVTAGGLIFIGATADEKFRAFDKETGAILWEADLPFGGNATPSTYMVDGKQYVVISAGGGKSNRPAGGSLVAFSLPN